MALIKPGIIRVPAVGNTARAARSVRSSRFPVRQRFVQQTGVRAYADKASGHTAKASSDLPWLITAVAVTVPSCWYLLQPSTSSHDHHDGKGHDTHGEDEHHDEEESEDKEEGETAEGEEHDEGGESAPAESDDESGSNEEGVDTGSGSEAPGSRDEPSKVSQPEAAETPESKGRVEGVKFKGPTNQGGDDKAAPDIRMRLPDSKGMTKKRIQSGYGTAIGANASEREGEKGSAKDKATSAKEPLSQNQMSGKQAGLSNTATKHSIDITQSPEKSKKGEGTAETAKLMGTVKPDRPMAENRSDDQEEA